MSGKRRPGPLGSNGEVEPIDAGTSAKIRMPAPALSHATKVDLNVVLPAERSDPGWLRVEVDGTAVAEFRVLGRGSTTVDGKPTGNPTRDPLRFAGDTPTGDYIGAGLESTVHLNQRSYGPWGAVRLRAVAGDALLAETLGRTGILLHGGDPGRFGGYRSTLGCLRLSNTDMRRLSDLLFSATDDALEFACGAVSVHVHVREF